MSAAEQRLRAAIEQHRAGDHAAAEAVYRAHLQEFPNDPSALHFLGLLRTQQSRNEEAITLMIAALESDPKYVDAWSNLGIAYYRQRDLVRAELCARKAIELDPDFANGWANLGMTLRAKNAHEEALIAWGRALELHPGMRNIAIAYGHLLYRLNRLSEAQEFYGRWQAASPDDPIPQHMLAAMGGTERPARASDGYVRATFDDFADSFDQNLQELGYRAPQLLFDAAMKVGALVPGQKVAVLDVGCGTGLCGALLRPLAARLVGVDLSPNMLAKAAARAVYDQLNCAELTVWVRECGQRFDLAVAADVLCYFGDLADALAGVKAALQPGGYFAFTLEELAAGAAGSSPEPFMLCAHGRYQHSRKYVEEVAASAALRTILVDNASLRQERQDPVAGLVVIVQALHA